MDEIESVLADHFKACFECTNTQSFDSIVQEIQSLPIPTLSNHNINLLNKPITPAEIEDTVFQLGSYKAPGLDGLPAFFYQNFRALLKLMSLILFWLSSTQVHFSLLSTIPLLLSCPKSPFLMR